jgi:ABC-2 type transport system permease protein
MFIGMLFSLAIPSQLKATELLMVISTPAFVLSGFTWPTSAFPSVISNVAQFIPLTQFLSAFRKIAFYGGNVTSVTTEINKLLLIILVSFTAMVALLQYKIYKYAKNKQENQESMKENPEPIQEPIEDLL